MSTNSNEQNTNSNRQISMDNGQWNQQTIYDARNILQTRNSTELSNIDEQRSGKSKLSTLI